MLKIYLAQLNPSLTTTSCTCSNRRKSCIWQSLSQKAERKRERRMKPLSLSAKTKSWRPSINNTKKLHYYECKWRTSNFHPHPPSWTAPFFCYLNHDVAKSKQVQAAAVNPLLWEIEDVLLWSENAAKLLGSINTSLKVLKESGGENPFFGQRGKWALLMIS